MRELEAHFADEGAAIGINLDENDPAEAVMGAHHIAVMDEIGFADHPVAMDAQGLSQAHPIDIGAVLEALMAPPVMAIPGRGALALPMPAATASDAAARMIFVLDMVISFIQWAACSCRPWGAP
jgi:hypothetical protein